MNESLRPISEALEAISIAIVSGWSSEATLQSNWGWNHPPLTKYELAEISSKLADRIKEFSHPFDSPIDPARLNNMSAALQSLKTHTIPQFYTGNGHIACGVFFNMMDYISNTLEPTLEWQILNDPKAFPAQTAKRVRNIQAEVDELVPDKVALAKQIALIQEATSAAESLPTDMKGLREARLKVSALAKDAAELFGQIDLHSKTAVEVIQEMGTKRIEALSIVDKCEEAYRITTTKGLAAAFEERANRLSTSMWWCVLGLAASLTCGVYIGYIRFAILSEVLKQTNPSWSIIWMHVMLSVTSISAPIWFAWLATKQISQRFRLSEDYAFKSSVAKAYEGFRKEAGNFDLGFQARLFDSALSRLEEAPLRLVENDTHGSPFHELISSVAFLKALDMVPELADKISGTHKKLVTKAKQKKVPVLETTE